MSMQDEDERSDKRGYVQLGVSKRLELVKIVEEENIPIKDAALRLNINYSTAKNIIKTFKRTGQVETKQMLKRKMILKKIPSLKKKVS